MQRLRHLPMRGIATLLGRAGKEATTIASGWLGAFTRSAALLIFPLVPELALSASCGPPQVIAPVAEVITEVLPEIRWSEVPGADSYRVQLESRLPEGHRLVSLDAQVKGTRFVAPQPLAEHRALVRVTLTAHCADGFGPPSDQGQGGHFRIDTASQCRLEGPISATLTPKEIATGAALAREAWLSWTAVPGALSYTLAFYSPEGGVLLGQFDVRQPSIRMPLPAFDVIGVAIQPSCAKGKGDVRYAVVSLTEG